MIDCVTVKYDQLQCTRQLKDALDLSLNFNCISTSRRTTGVHKVPGEPAGGLPWAYSQYRALRASESAHPSSARCTFFEGAGALNLGEIYKL